MKFFIASIFSTLVLDLSGQNQRELAFPFQVLFAKNVKNASQKEIKSLDLISKNDSLKIEKGGTLCLIHYSGLPVDVSNDTVVAIRDLSDALLPKDKINNSKKQNEALASPYLERLFISNGLIARKDKLNRTGVCMDCNFDMELIYPPSNRRTSVDFFDDNGLCLKWRPTKLNKFKIEINSMFNDLIDSVTLYRNELNASSDQLKKWKGENDFVMIKLINLENPNFSARTYVFKQFSAKPIQYPWSCELKKASFALIAGLFLEMSARSYYEEAEQYYVLATKLSDDPFYQTMLENFRKRTANP